MTRVARRERRRLTPAEIGRNRNTAFIRLRASRCFSEPRTERVFERSKRPAPHPLTPLRSVRGSERNQDARSVAFHFLRGTQEPLDSAGGATGPPGRRRKPSRT